MSEEEYYEEEEGEEEEEEYEEDEEEEEEEGQEEEEGKAWDETKSQRTAISEGEEILRARTEAKKGELDEQLKDYINEWRKQREKEEEELRKLKEQQARRKEIRAEQEKKLALQKKEEEERIRMEQSDRKMKEAEEKRKRLEEAEKKRQMMMEAQKDKQESGGYEFKKSEGRMPMTVKDGKKEVTKTKEQLEEEKKISLSIRIKPLDLEGCGLEGLKGKAADLWENIVRLETEKYDLEERQKRQGYDLKELSERQTQRLRLKAVRMGLHAEALTGKYPPKIHMYSKYERRTDIRTYDERKGLYNGGWEILATEVLEREWKGKYEEWTSGQKSTKLPKWFGVRPGKKAGDPDTPEEDEAAAVAENADEDIDELGEIREEVEEEEDEEEYEEEEDEEGDEEEEE